jgi:hypothetical protein
MSFVQMSFVQMSFVRLSFVRLSFIQMSLYVVLNLSQRPAMFIETISLKLCQRWTEQCSSTFTYVHNYRFRWFRHSMHIALITLRRYLCFAFKVKMATCMSVTYLHTFVTPSQVFDTWWRYVLDETQSRIFHCKHWSTFVLLTFQRYARKVGYSWKTFFFFLVPMYVCTYVCTLDQSETKSLTILRRSML